jgi:hypothetical protein
MDYILVFKHSKHTGHVVLVAIPCSNDSDDVLSLNHEEYSIKKDAKYRIPVKKVVERFVELHPGAKVRVKINANDRFDVKDTHISSIVVKQSTTFFDKFVRTDADKTQVEHIKVKLNGYSLFSLFNLNLFPNLKELFINDTLNNSIELNGRSLNVLDLSNNRFTNLDLSGVPLLKHLKVAFNKLTSIDLSKVPLLETLDISGNCLTGIDLSGVPLLVRLNVVINNLTTIDLTGMPLLKKACLCRNSLSALDISNPELTNLSCSNNELNGLFRLTKKAVPNLKKLDISSNRIGVLFLPNLHLKYVKTNSNHVLKALYFKGTCDVPLTSDSSLLGRTTFASYVTDPTIVNFPYCNKVWIASNVNYKGQLRIVERFFHQSKTAQVVKTLPLPIADEVLEHISSFKTDYERELLWLEDLRNASGVYE